MSRKTWALLVLAAMLAVIPASAYQLRQLRLAPICEEGYDLYGGCVSKNGVYFESEDKTLYFSDQGAWTSFLIEKAFGILLDQFVPTCIQDLFDDFIITDQCACSLLCKKSTVASSVCEYACDKLIDFQLDLNPVKDGVVDTVDQVVDGVSDVVDEASGGGSSGCFPSDAIVTMWDGSYRRMSELEVGDKVMGRVGGKPAVTTIYGFAHHIFDGLYTYISIETETGPTITATPDHYICIAQKTNGTQNDWHNTIARDVRPGNLVWVLNQNRNAFESTKVTKVVLQEAKGLINPFTMDGNIVVNGVLASVYNDLMGEEDRMHAFVSFIRTMYRTSPFLMKTIHRSGLHHLCSRFLISVLEVANGHGFASKIAGTIISTTSLAFP